MLNWYKILACKLLKNSPFPQKNGEKKNLITNLSENLVVLARRLRFLFMIFQNLRFIILPFFFFFFFSFQNL